MRKNNKRSKTLKTTRIDMQNMLNKVKNNENNSQNKTIQPQNRNETTNFFDSRNCSSELLIKTKFKFFNNETNPYSNTKKSATSSVLPKINSNCSITQKPNKTNIILIKNNQNQTTINKNGFRISSDSILKRKINENASSQTKNTNQVNLIQKQPKTNSNSNNNNNNQDNNVMQRRNKKTSTTQIVSRDNKQVVLVLNPHSPLKNGHFLNKNKSSADILVSSRKHLLSGEDNNNNSEKDIHKKRAKAYHKEYAKDADYSYIKNAALSQRGLDENGKLKQNQDSYILIENIFNLEKFSIFGVFDGHGSNGHVVSQFIKRRAEEYFSEPTTYSRKPQTTFTHEKILHHLKANNYAIITKFNSIVHNELEQEKIDINFSGSTCVIVFHICDSLIISNCGDSRAILIKEKEKSKSKHHSHNKSHYSVIQLSTDHKPELPKEKERIEKYGGTISQYEEDNGEFDGPMRVWVKGKDYPGIATSRSIGDTVAKKVGVVYDADITMYEIDENVKYLVVASDGVWEFLSNKDVMKIIKPYFKSGDIEEACKEVVNKSIEKWEEEDYGRDDITLVVSFLGKPTNKKGDA